MKGRWTPPHGWRVSFPNEELGYANDEFTVYRDGFDEATATDIASLTLYGVTSRAAALGFARYHTYLTVDMGRRTEDWPEDAGDHGGVYSSTCHDCGIVFRGHRRRFQCRGCAARDSRGPTVLAGLWLVVVVAAAVGILVLGRPV